MSFSPLRGLSVPVITVVDDAGNLLEDQQRRVLRYLVQDGYGANLLFVNGTTGEWNRLDALQCRRLMAVAADEIRAINDRLKAQARPPVALWIGINGRRRREVLANLDMALQVGADGIVIAPLAIDDVADADVLRFFQRDIEARFDAACREIPVYLYDNADIHVHGRPPHMRTRMVKNLSRLPWIRGIKVSAPRRVLGHYTKAALHYKLPGEFAIYIGNAPLIFDWFRPRSGLIGRMWDAWHEYLMHDALPVGVVSGPANVLPREWQKAWRVCWSGDDQLVGVLQAFCRSFEALCVFEEEGRTGGKLLACLKEALRLDGVIECAAVARGTPHLRDGQRESFRERYRDWQALAWPLIPLVWRSQCALRD